MIRRFFVVSVIFSIVFGLSAQVFAQTETQVSLNLETVQKGYTVHHENGAFRLGLRTGTVNEAVTVSVKNVTETLPAFPDGWKAVSPLYEFSVRGSVTNPLFFQRNALLAIQSTPQQRYAERALFNWDANKQTWNRLASQSNALGTKVTAKVRFPYSIVVALENDRVLHGVASWYGAKKTATAAANAYPMGTKLLVTNKENGKSVSVKVVSTGPFARGRVVDLSKDAFKKLAPLGVGVIHVTVRAANGIAPTDDPVQRLPAPRVRSASAFVMDAQSGQMLYEKNPDLVRPIASITKLMTGLMVLEAKTPFSNVVTIDATDAAGGARLGVRAGETLTVKNLFYSTLTASANNAALALARATGMSRPDFVTAMNARAKQMGLTFTQFVEPSGLDPKNIGTAREVALLARETFRPLPVLQATTVTEYGFSTKNTEKPHHFKNTNTLVGSSLHITGSKTGYLDEAGYTLVVRARNKMNTKSVIAVVLGSDTSKRRFGETKALAEWALAL